MKHRKIQLIAGTTYSISLPKDWVKRNNLREGQELVISEREDKNLVLGPTLSKEIGREKIVINADEYVGSIDRVLLELYYLGFLNIDLISRKQDVNTKIAIRKTISCMSGAIINYQDEQKTSISILLDKTKVDVIQLLYRMSLILEESILNLTERCDANVLLVNENEIDMLYHLVTKIISLAVKDSLLLNSSKIGQAQLIPSYLLVSKKLENLGDKIFYMANSAREITPKNKEVLLSIKEELRRTMKHVLADYSSMFARIQDQKLNELKKTIGLVKDQTTIDYLNNAIRFLVDIQEEVINISFYKSLMRKGVI